MTTRMPWSDRPLVLYDLLHRIARLKAEHADPAEIE